MEIPPAGYLFSQQSVNPAWKCVIAVRGGGTNETEINFGTYLLANYYSEFHYDNLTMGLAVNSKNSWNATIEYSDSEDDDDGLSTFGVVMIVLSCLILICGLVGVLYYCGRKEKTGNSSKKTQHYDISPSEDPTDTQDLMDKES